jgi:hypothetical protein
VQNFSNYSGLAYLFIKQIMIQLILSSHICFWFSRFKSGEISGEDCKCSGPISAGCTDENMEKVGRIFEEDKRSAIWNIAGNLGFSYGLCQLLREGGTRTYGDLRGVCASVAHRRAEAVMCLCARNCWMKSETAQTSCRASLQEIKPGLTLTTRKKISRFPS